MFTNSINRSITNVYVLQAGFPGSTYKICLLQIYTACQNYAQLLTRVPRKDKEKKENQERRNTMHLLFSTEGFGLVSSLPVQFLNCVKPGNRPYDHLKAIL